MELETLFALIGLVGAFALGYAIGKIFGRGK